MSDLSSTEIAIQNRKFAKTCVEKKRRDRINKCLDELKELMSQADDKARYQKMEKAEILEMAVAFMRNLRVNGVSLDMSSSTSNQPSFQYYTMAYRQCLNEFQNFLCVFPGIQDEFKSTIMNYMSQRYMELIANAQNNISNQENSNLNTSSANEEKTSPTVINHKKFSKVNRHSPYYTKSPHKKQHKQSSTKVTSEDGEQSLNMMSIMTNEQNLSSSLLSSSSSGAASPNTKMFGGSCSSLDSFTNNQNSQNMNQHSAASPGASSNASDMLNNDESSHRFSMNSANSSPNSSICSSPTTATNNNNSCSAKQKIKQDIFSTAGFNFDEQTLAALNFSNFAFYQNCLMKVWRPW